MNESYKYCFDKINLMIKRSKTKIIFPIITYGLLIDYINERKIIFEDNEIKKSYQNAVNKFKEILGHDIHIGGKYYDAYPSRNLPKYGVLSVLANKKYELAANYYNNANKLVDTIPQLVKSFIDDKLGSIPIFDNPKVRFEKTKNNIIFFDLIENQIEINPTNFEIFCFAILKVHLEKFACKIYRDTRTSAHDKGVDLSTNFGVIYQIKKLKLLNENSAKNIYNELQTNFSSDRLQDGNVILIIDDISKDVKSFLINMKVQTITKSELLKLVRLLEVEDRMKVLKIVYDEFCREYKSDI
ncbi:MAG: HaeII family restriction endonuclease [Bacteroidales bacterium]|nr:HaeII family restriction endonuclease [Bacteroidales bacterium]